MTLVSCGGDDATDDLKKVAEESNSAPSIADQTFSVPENSAIGTAVGTVKASDDDGDSLVFSIINGNTGDAFQIAANTGL